MHSIETNTVLIGLLDFQAFIRYRFQRSQDANAISISINKKSGYICGIDSCNKVS